MSELRRTGPSLDPWLPAMTYPKILGSYLAVNAVPDVWMLVDSPDCATLRAEIVAENHDWNSTLITSDGRYRIATSGVSPDTITMDRRDSLKTAIAEIVNNTTGHLFIYPGTMAALTGVDYSGLVQDINGSGVKRVVDVKLVETQGDWVDGYTMMTSLLASSIDLPDVPTDSNTVAFTGYLWDRNEGDHVASVDELRRLCGFLDLKVSAVWLSGCPLSSLAQVASAGTIIALPHSGQTAEVLARRTGARVLEMPLPMGLSGTVEWMERLAVEFHREVQFESFRNRVAGPAAERLWKPMLLRLRGQDVVISTEAVLSDGLVRWCEDLGMNVRLVATCGARRLNGPDLSDWRDRVLAPASGEYLESPSHSGFRHQVEGLLDGGRPMVLLANTPAILATRGLGLVALPIGFQSPGYHYLGDAPFVGVAGAVSLAERVAQALSHHLVTGPEN